MECLANCRLIWLIKMVRGICLCLCIQVSENFSRCENRVIKYVCGAKSGETNIKPIVFQQWDFIFGFENNEILGNFEIEEVWLSEVKFLL